MSRLTDGALILFAIVAAFWLGMLRGYADGAQQERDAAELRERRVSDQHAQALARANERQRAVEAALRTDLADQAATFRKAMLHEQAQRDRLVAGLRSGAVRLSVPVTAASGAACGAPAGGSPAAAPGDRHPARAELAPAAAADLAALADDGDAATRQLNACIDAYDAVRRRLNAASAQGPAHAQAQ